MGQVIDFRADHRIEEIERELSRLRRECSEKIVAIAYAYEPRTDPLEKRLEELKRKHLEPDAVRKQLRAVYELCDRLRAEKKDLEELPKSEDSEDRLEANQEILRETFSESVHLEKNLELLGAEPEYSSKEYGHILGCLRWVRHAAEYKRMGMYLVSTLKELAEAKQNLVFWTTRKKIHRPSLATVAEQKRQEKIAELSERLEKARQELKATHENLRRGTVLSGKRRGQPYSQKYLNGLRERLSRTRDYLGRLSDGITALTSRDPIRAWTIDDVRYKLAGELPPAAKTEEQAQA